MNENEIDHLRAWIGREERRSEPLTRALVDRFAATFGRPVADDAQEAPLAIHWCLTQPAVVPDGLGSDGHPARGGFLPPVPLPRRMWAGGELAFLAPLRIGRDVTRVSRIADVAHKKGRSGELVFVAVEHEILSGDVLAVRERQDIVYRAMEEKGAPSAPVPARPAAGEPRHADHREEVQATTTLLFRYSALTFNGHRIHYDLDYARDVEGYSGLVVHGPLQATLMLHMASRIAGNKAPARFAYRGVAPLVHGGAFTVNAARSESGLDLWTAGADGATRMSATAVFA